MNTELALWKVVINLPESLKKELLHYAEYLREKYPNNKQSQSIIELYSALTFPSDHRDPFDRMLIVQAINHSLILISTDVLYFDRWLLFIPRCIQENIFNLTK